MDWIATGFLLSGTYLLSRKNKWGWLVNTAGSILMIIVFLHMPSLIILNSVFAAQALYGFWKWSRSEN